MFEATLIVISGIACHLIHGLITKNTDTMTKVSLGYILAGLWAWSVFNTLLNVSGQDIKSFGILFLTVAVPAIPLGLLAERVKKCRVRIAVVF
jgi:hypothetical protein